MNNEDSYIEEVIKEGVAKAILEAIKENRDDLRQCISVEPVDVTKHELARARLVLSRIERLIEERDK